MEANEIPELTKEIQEGGQHSLTHISVAISILAVLVAMVTVLGHRSHTEAILVQSRANDQWSEYQAKKIRYDNLSVTIRVLPLQPSTNAAALEQELKKERDQLDKWEKDLPELQKTAREYDREVTLAEAHASRFDLGEALLQIAVILVSITLLTRRNAYFYTGVTLGVAGLLCAASALLIH